MVISQKGDLNFKNEIDILIEYNKTTIHSDRNTTTIDNDRDRYTEW